MKDDGDADADDDAEKEEVAGEANSADVVGWKIVPAAPALAPTAADKRGVDIAALAVARRRILSVSSLMACFQCSAVTSWHAPGPSTPPSPVVGVAAAAAAVAVGVVVAAMRRAIESQRWKSLAATDASTWRSRTKSFSASCGKIIIAIKRSRLKRSAQSYAWQMRCEM